MVAYDSKKIAATMLVLLPISPAAASGGMNGLATTPMLAEANALST
jgi:hypothetical protein